LGYRRYNFVKALQNHNKAVLERFGEIGWKHLS